MARKHGFFRPHLGRSFPQVASTTLREGVGWSPLALGSSLLAWWTADRADLITLSGSQVTSWKDVVASYNLVQGVSASRPLWSATNFNGAPCVTYDGVDDEVTLGSQPLPSGATAAEVWAIVSQDALVADTSGRTYFSYGGTAGATRRSFERAVNGGQNNPNTSIGDGATIGGVSVTADFSGRSLVRTQVGATATTVTLNGSTSNSGNVVPSTGTTRVRLGAIAGNTASGFWNGSVRDIVVTSTLTADQAAQMQAWALLRRML